MPDKDPTTWSLATWMLGAGIASLGGAVNWIIRVRQGKTQIFNILELVGELVISGFVGVVAFMAMLSYAQPIAMCAAVAGVAGHMGTRLLFAAGRILESKVSKIEREDKGE